MDTKKTNNKKVSKLSIDEKNLDSNTNPNPIVMGQDNVIEVTRINPLDVPKYQLMHPAVPRGIEMKVNRIIKLIDKNLNNNVLINPVSGNLSLAEEARQYCRKVLINSGGIRFVKKMMSGAYSFGTSFAVLQPNVDNTEILRLEHQHEIFFGPSKYPEDKNDKRWGDTPKIQREMLAGKNKINRKSKQISKFTQYTIPYEDIYSTSISINGINSGGNKKLIPYGKEFDEDIVSTLKFDTIGDEPLGISIYQSVMLTILYLLNMEKAGAQTLVKFGFNQYKVMTDFTDEDQMKKFAKMLSNIQKDSVIILPSGVTLDNIEPGSTEFDKIHPIYLQLIAIRLGIPMPLLTQNGSETNKSTVGETRKEMYEDFFSDELEVEAMINDAFFKICKIKYNKLSNKELQKIVPYFEFNDPPEDQDQKQERDTKFAFGIKSLSSSYKLLKDSGANQEIIKKLEKNIEILLDNKIKEKESHDNTKIPTPGNDNILEFENEE